jgi:hypothetical protein
MVGGVKKDGVVFGSYTHHPKPNIFYGEFVRIASQPVLG